MKFAISWQASGNHFSTDQMHVSHFPAKVLGVLLLAHGGSNNGTVQLVRDNHVCLSAGTRVTANSVVGARSWLPSPGMAPAVLQLRRRQADRAE
jgi:hypothetical protein